MASEHVLGGDIYGARCLASLDQLTSDQLDVAKEILQLVHRIGLRTSVQRSVRQQRVRQASHEGTAYDLDDFLDDQTRPSHVVVVDGSRGTGKTTLLLTL